MYYKFKVSYYKVDTDTKSFIQVNSADDAVSVGIISNLRAFDNLVNIINNNTGGEWVVISEEEFIFTKQQVLNKLNQ